MNSKFLRTRRLFGVAIGAMGLTLALATPALAHTPIVLTERNVLPWTSPLILDGTDPVALFGVLPHCASIRSARFHMEAGQQVSLAYGVPNEAPENQLPATDLPDVILVSPDGGVTVLKPTFRQVITPEGTMQLLLVDGYSATAVTGTYDLLLVGGCSASRVFVTLGSDPGDFDGVRHGSVATEAQVESWYNTPPTADPDAAHR